jgi:hypothetical protein
MKSRLIPVPVFTLPFPSLRPFVPPLLGPFVASTTPAVPFRVEATDHQAKRSHTGEQEEKPLFHGGLLRSDRETEHVLSQ